MVTELDLVLQYDYARKEGEAIGEARGRAEGKAEEKSAIAWRMLEAGLPLDVIAECSGLSEDEVRELTQLSEWRMLEDGVPAETVAKYSGLTKEDVLKLAQPQPVHYTPWMGCSYYLTKVQ